MLDKTFHLSDRELLLAADRELPARRQVGVREHLAGCASCRARMSEMARTLGAAAESCRGLPTPMPPPSAARAQLRLRLTELSRQPRHSRAFWIGSWAVACGVVLAASIGLGALLGRRTAHSFGAVDHTAAVFLLPRADLTPGMARPVNLTDICGTGGRPQLIPVSLHERVFESYGADFRRSAEYELDYLITPALGGTPDARNLWPQPFTGTAWNAYVKDELELRLHRLVCDGALDVGTAQLELASNWIAAYKRHFNTERPLRDYAASPLTEHDGDLLRGELEELGLATPEDSANGPRLLAMVQAGRQGTVLRVLSLPAGE
ncbi:MAG: hypothetical protein GEU82_05515 [Luteitalea sp.]|nr:hypothetical protein [Luteitalea sp.]